MEGLAMQFAEDSIISETNEALGGTRELVRHSWHLQAKSQLAIDRAEKTLRETRKLLRRPLRDLHGTVDMEQR
jgi:hypothetical protein